MKNWSGQEKFSKTTLSVIVPFSKIYVDLFIDEEGAGGSAEPVLADTKRAKA